MSRAMHSLQHRSRIIIILYQSRVGIHLALGRLKFTPSVRAGADGRGEDDIFLIKHVPKIKSKNAPKMFQKCSKDTLIYICEEDKKKSSFSNRNKTEMQTFLNSFLKRTKKKSSFSNRNKAETPEINSTISLLRFSPFVIWHTGIWAPRKA